MKYIQLFKNIIYSILCISAFLLSSCSNDENYDIKGDTINRVYVNTPTVIKNIFDFKVIVTPVSTIGNLKSTFVAYSTQFTSNDIKVTFDIDNSLVEKYNATSTIKYSPISSDLVTMLNKQVVINKGDLSSKDSVTVTIPKEKIALLTQGNYVLPVKISSISQSDNFAISTQQNVVYIKINISSSNVYDSPKVEDMTGTIISDRSGWVATNFRSNSDNFFDGDNQTSGANFSDRDQPFDFDLGQTYNNITGIRILPYFNFYYVVEQTEVLTSTDGITWKSQGVANLNVSGLIKFYSSIQSVRYVKLNVKSQGTNQYYFIAEFDLYQN